MISLKKRSQIIVSIIIAVLVYYFFKDDLFLINLHFSVYFFNQIALIYNPDQNNDFSQSMINDFGDLKNVNMSRNKTLVHELYHAIRIIKGFGRLKDGTFIDYPTKR